MSNKDLESNKNKILVYVFVPLGNCTCMHNNFINKVFEIIIPYKQKIIFEVKNIASPLADKFNLIRNSIVVIEDPLNLEKFLVFQTPSAFKKYITNKFGI
ncbi:MAG: hypothetical protein ACTSRZ_00665 [Promethearchaeota archaeon]